MRGGERAAARPATRERVADAADRAAHRSGARGARARGGGAARLRHRAATGPAGEALARAQDDTRPAWTTFPDVAANHAALGWLEAERGQLAEAHASARPCASGSTRARRGRWVVKGVIAARDGQLRRKRWSSGRKAKALEPDYPNIDQLIAEAEKRKAGVARVQPFVVG